MERGTGKHFNTVSTGSTLGYKAHEATDRGLVPSGESLGAACLEMSCAWWSFYCLSLWDPPKAEIHPKSTGQSDLDRDVISMQRMAWSTLNVTTVQLASSKATSHLSFTASALQRCQQKGWHITGRCWGHTWDLHGKRRVAAGKPVSPTAMVRSRGVSIRY